MKKLIFNIILKSFLDDEQSPRVYEFQNSVYHSSKQLDVDIISYNQKSLDLVLAQYGEKIDDQISFVFNKEKLKGVVVLCEEKAVGDVDFVVKESSDAIAVISRIQPQVDTNVPVLVLSEEEFIEVMKFGTQHVKVDLQCSFSDDNPSFNSNESFYPISKIDEDLNLPESKVEDIADISITSPMLKTSKNDDFCETKIIEHHADSMQRCSKQRFDLKDGSNITESNTHLVHISDESFLSKQMGLDFELKPNKIECVLESKGEVTKDYAVTSNLENLLTDPINFIGEKMDASSVQYKKGQEYLIIEKKRLMIS